MNSRTCRHVASCVSGVLTLVYVCARAGGAARGRCDGGGDGGDAAGAAGAAAACRAAGAVGAGLRRARWPHTRYLALIMLTTLYFRCHRSGRKIAD